jgi:CheY-like chemotaxis protein
MRAAKRGRRSGANALSPSVRYAHRLNLAVHKVTGAVRPISVSSGRCFPESCSAAPKTVQPSSKAEELHVRTKDSGVGRLRLAILNDSPHVVQLLCDWFRQHGHRCATRMVADMPLAHVEVEQFINEYRPDVVVYDVPMPYGSSWDLLDVIRANAYAPIATLCDHHTQQAKAGTGRGSHIGHRDRRPARGSATAAQGRGKSRNVGRGRMIRPHCYEPTCHWVASFASHWTRETRPSGPVCTTAQTSDRHSAKIKWEDNSHWHVAPRAGLVPHSTQRQKGHLCFALSVLRSVSC